MIPLEEIKEYLSKAELPKRVELQNGMIISNPKKFIESHIATLERNPNNKTFDSFKTRLETFYNLIRQHGIRTKDLPENT